MYLAQDTPSLKLSSPQVTLLYCITQTSPLLLPATVEITLAETSLHFLHTASHHHHQSFNREGRWGTTDDSATSFIHFPLFPTAHGDFPNSRPVQNTVVWSCFPFIRSGQNHLARRQEDIQPMETAIHSLHGLWYHDTAALTHCLSALRQEHYVLLSQASSLHYPWFTKVQTVSFVSSTTSSHSL